ncbi:DUF1430 domain-containing protein [Paenibacillus barengoltzii]|uniref:DUF1430 domain-containing protein n=1 Tax=Paenibacillus barengoltzii TaxID=343517 RepID=UPI002DBDD176|nr:DUF1430 domain-containing protein [Paenibacillus barengoltzii]MEC2345500.1 DUF1430 domain-containing protein [Paenibacillus barengoltzii]
MKLLKYIICFCVFLFGLLIIGESQRFRLDNFFTPYHYTSFYLQFSQNENDMKQDILKASEKNGVEFFTFIKNSNHNVTEIKLYGSSGAEKKIEEISSIHYREYKTLFLGDIQFSFHPFEQIEGLENIHDFYLIGTSRQVEKFKSELIDKYAGNFPQEGYVNQDTTYLIIGIWVLMISITLVLTYYDVLYQKKENLIRITMGEQLSTLIWRNIAIDSLVYILILACLFFLLGKVTSVFLSLQISFYGFSALLVLNALVYLTSRSYPIREAFSNANSSSRKLLAINYILKLISVMITTFAISSNLVFAFDSYNVYKQKVFFEEFADYSYITLRYRPIVKSNGEGDPKFKESELLQSKFYTDHFRNANATLLSKVHDTLGTIPTIMANRNAVSYLIEKIPELEKIRKDISVYFILPDSLATNESLLPQLEDKYDFFENNNIGKDYEVLYYKKTVNLVAIDQNHIYGSERVKNPIIILNNLLPEEELKLNYIPSKGVYMYEIMYDISDEEFRQFVQKHHLTESTAIFSKMNVLNKYNESWNIAKKVLYINSIFSVLVLFLEFIIIASIIKLEYEVNAIELSIKKVLGYSIWQKNWKIIWITLATTAISIGCSVVISQYLGLGLSKFLLFGGIIIFVSELIAILTYVRKVEKSKISKILKGGNL